MCWDVLFQVRQTPPDGYYLVIGLVGFYFSLLNIL